MSTVYVAWGEGTQCRVFGGDDYSAANRAEHYLETCGFRLMDSDDDAFNDSWTFKDYEHPVSKLVAHIERREVEE